MAEPIDIILKLGVDSTGVVQEIDKVKSKYGEVNTEVKKNQDQLKQLLADEKALLAERAKTNSPTIVAQFNNEIKKNRIEIEKLTASTKLQTKELKETGAAGTKTKQDLDKAFDVTKTISLRSQIRKLREDLANATDPDEINRLAIETGKLTDKMEDAAEAARVFSTESKFQSVGTALGNVGSKLLQLDFKGAADASNLLVKASSSITFKDALGGVKQLGTTLFNVGRALLTNPLFLIGAAVGIIIANFDKLKNASGPIGEAFRFVGTIIDGVKNSFFLLTDAIGLTNHALEEFTEKRINQLTTGFENTQKLIQREIDIRKAAGKETEELEINKLKAIIKNSKDQLTLLNKVYKESDNERRDSLIDAALDADTQIKVIEAGAIKRKKDEADKASKKFREDNDKLMDEAQKEADRLSDIEQKIEARNFQRRIDQGEKVIAAGEKAVEEDINERQRHANAILSIEEASNILILESEIEFEKERLGILKFSAGEFSQEVINQNNKILELELKKTSELNKLDDKRTKEAIANAKRIADVSIQAANQILSAKIKELDGQTSAQERRVEEATRLAEKGNTELLELEKKRLDDLNKEKEKFVRAQQALAVIQLIADTAVTIAAAAAEGATSGGGIGAAVSIAAALIALIAGLASARSLAGQAAFFTGGETGEGNIHDQSTKLGNKPYIYHKKEFIFNNEKTSKYIDVFRKVHNGEVDLNDWQNKINSFNNMDLSRQVVMTPMFNNNNDLKDSMKNIERAINSQERTKVIFDENGIAIIATHYIDKQKRLDRIAS